MRASTAFRFAFSLVASVILGACGETDATEEAEDVARIATDPANLLRIMSFNIKYGAIVNVDLTKIAEVIKTNRPDVLALQEVDDGTRRSGGQKETAELSRLTGMPYFYFGAAFPYDGGQYGGAILSTRPLVNPRTVRLDDHTATADGFEPRIAVAAEIALPHETMTFVGAHLSLHAEERSLNATRILAAIGANADHAIVVGDMNETPGQAVSAVLKPAGFVDAFHERHSMSPGWTIPAERPTRRIDMIYRGSNFGATQHAWIPDTRTSDHRPIAAVVPID